jgi:hypothetical protein
VAGFIGVVGLSGGGSATSADGEAQKLPSEWPPLSETCNDVSGDGLVDLPNDILQVILHHNTKWGDDEYALVYDVDGGGVIDLPNDILSTVLAFHPSGPNPDCSLIDTQVIRSAAALLPYADCDDAVADGYGSTGVNVPDMGIHISKTANLKTTFDPDDWDGTNATSATDLANPFGLVCSSDGEGGVGKLIGPWYIIPVASTGTLYGQQPPFQPDNTVPDGFATGIDYIPYDLTNGGVQAAWHQHLNLCVGQGFLAEQGPGGSHQSCKGIGGFLNVPLYGWMLHLYNFVPNTALAVQQAEQQGTAGADARFMRWNRNPDFPICEFEPTGCGGGGGVVAGEDVLAFDGASCPINLAFLAPTS